MNKPFTDYVRYAIKFYVRHLDIVNFKKKAVENNWNACHKVISSYSTRDKDILVYIYGERDTLADNVYNASVKYKLHQNIIWSMTEDFEEKVAIERGLI
jgi:hypothetical protein